MPAARGELAAGRHAEPEDDEVGGDVTGRRHDGVRLEPGHLGARPHVDAAAAQGVGDAGSEVLVDHAQRLRSALDHRRRAPPLDVGLGHLEPDVAAADDDDPPAPLVGERQQHLGVGEALHAVDEGEVDAGQVRSHRLAAGGDQQLVVADELRGAGVLVEHLDLALGDVDRRRVVVGAHVDAALAVGLGGAGHEGLDAAGDQTTHEERDAAGRVAREPRLLEHDDLGVRARGLDARGRRHAGRVAPDDQRSQRHRPVLTGRRRRQDSDHGDRRGPGDRVRRRDTGRRQPLQRLRPRPRRRVHGLGRRPRRPGRAWHRRGDERWRLAVVVRQRRRRAPAGA